MLKTKTKQFMRNFHHGLKQKETDAWPGLRSADIFCVTLIQQGYRKTPQIPDKDRGQG